MVIALSSQEWVFRVLPERWNAQTEQMTTVWVHQSLVVDLLALIFNKETKYNIIFSMCSFSYILLYNMI